MTKKRIVGAGLLLSALSLVAPGAALAAYPGTNGAVAFTSTQGGGARHIFVARSTGITDLTGVSSPADQLQPRFSPDGREILFTDEAPGLPNSEIYVMGADGRQPTALTNTPAGNSDATWSPDGTQVAFVSVRNGEGPNIFVMRTDGTGLHQITHDAAGKSELAWSPQGQRLVFVREPAGGGDREIYSIRADGSGLSDLTNDPTNDDIEPAWAPDGSQIVFSGPLHPSGSAGSDLWLMSADGSNQRPLIHLMNGYSDGAYPAWSPDGNTIAHRQQRHRLRARVVGAGRRRQQQRTREQPSAGGQPGGRGRRLGACAVGGCAPHRAHEGQGDQGVAELRARGQRPGDWLPVSVAGGRPCRQVPLVPAGAELHGPGARSLHADSGGSRPGRAV